MLVPGHAPLASALASSCTHATTRVAVNFRKAPNGELREALAPGALLDVIDAGTATGWAKVRVNGVEGYVKATYLDCSDPKPELHAASVAVGTIAVDGMIDALWASAERTSFDTTWAGVHGPSRTTVRALWSEGGLYLLWEIDGTDLNVDGSRPVTSERANLYEEDCVEMFLAPDPADAKRYFEIELGPRGHFFDLRIDRNLNTSDAAWSSEAVIATQADAAARHAVIEVWLRSPDITRALHRGAKLPMNMFRMEGKAPRQYLAWAPTRTARPNFHVPEAFGKLVLE